jgi:hypothetical protein
MAPINIDKLPKYAQDEITSLRRQVATLRQSLLDQQQTTPTKISWGNIFKDSAHGYLRDDEQVEFAISQHVRIRARITEDGLYINGDHCLAILCEASNCVTVTERKR